MLVLLMPKNERIIEKLVGIDETSKQEVWDRIFDLSKLQLEDRIRIFEDRLAKSDNITLIDGYITKLPKIDEDSKYGLTELEFETVNTRKARLEQERLAKLNKI